MARLRILLGFDGMYFPFGPVTQLRRGVFTMRESEQKTRIFVAEVVKTFDPSVSVEALPKYPKLLTSSATSVRL